MSSLLGHRPFLWITHRTGHNSPHGPSADKWVLTTANADGTNGLTCLPKHGRARDFTYLVIHPLIDLSERCLTFSIALTTGLSSSSFHISHEMPYRSTWIAFPRAQKSSAIPSYAVPSLSGTRCHHVFPPSYSMDSFKRSVKKHLVNILCHYKKKKTTQQSACGGVINFRNSCLLRIYPFKLVPLKL
jgi:hypothetical protein